MLGSKERAILQQHMCSVQTSRTTSLGQKGRKISLDESFVQSKLWNSYLFSGICIKKNNKKNIFQLKQLKSRSSAAPSATGPSGKRLTWWSTWPPTGGSKKNQHCECWEANTRNTIGSIGTLEYAINLPWCFIFSNQYPASMTVLNLPWRYLHGAAALHNLLSYFKPFLLLYFRLQFFGRFPIFWLGLSQHRKMLSLHFWKSFKQHSIH